MILCVGILVSFTGCENSKNPTSFEELDERLIQVAPTRPSEDTTGSEIESLQYPEGTIVIVAVGDSITYGWDSTMGGYPAMLETKLLTAGYNVVVVNEGIPGERSPATENRFLKVIAGADIALIMIGINDIVNPMGCPQPFNCQTVGHIEALLDKALISKTVPLVSTVTPANPDGSYSWANFGVRNLNGLIYEIAVERDVYIVDNYIAVLNNGGSALYADNLHFTDLGYDLLAQQWYDVIVENGIIESLDKENEN